MKISYLLILVFFIHASCTESNDVMERATGSSNTDNTKAITEDTLEENSAQAKKAELSSMKFEDYVALNTREILKSVFNDENCKDGSSLYAEGTVSYNHTIVTNPATTHEVKYVWDENDDLVFVEATYKKYDDDFNETGIQMLESECGVHLGMGLKELVKWNNKAISFSGFGWDFGGSIRTDKDSKLASCPVTLNLGIDYKKDLNSEIMGDILLSSNDEVVQETPIYVSSFMISLE